jgi:hypothetical protein
MSSAVRRPGVGHPRLGAEQAQAVRGRGQPSRRDVAGRSARPTPQVETACRRGGALALRPSDLDPDQCLILLREKGETVRWQPVSPTLMAALARHAEERHAPPDGRLLRYRNGRPVTYRRYDGLWVRIGRHLPWVRTQQISTHWLRTHPLDLGRAQLRVRHRPRLRRAHRRLRRHRRRHLDVRPRRPPPPSPR